MEKIISEFMTTLDGKITDQDMIVVKDQMIMFFRNYNITKKETALAPLNDDVLKELKEYLVSLKIEGSSDKTLKQYKLALSRFLYWASKPCKDITSSDIKFFLYNLQQTTGMKDISLDNQRSYINAFFTWLVNNDYLEKNPCKNIKPIKHEKNTRHPLTPIEMERLRAVCKTSRDRAIIEFMYATACRCEEMVNLTLTDINFDTKEVHLFGKGKKARTSYLNARALVAIQVYLKERGNVSPFLICSIKKPHQKLTTRQIEKIVRKLGNEAGVDVTPHVIRHTTATDAIDKGMPIEQVRQLLGHESIQTTLIYAETKQDNVKHGHEKYIV